MLLLHLLLVLELRYLREVPRPFAFGYVNGERARLKIASSLCSNPSPLSKLHAVSEASCAPGMRIDERLQLCRLTTSDRDRE